MKKAMFFALLVSFAAANTTTTANAGYYNDYREYGYDLEHCSNCNLHHYGYHQCPKQSFAKKTLKATIVALAAVAVIYGADYALQYGQALGLPKEAFGYEFGTLCTQTGVILSAGKVAAARYLGTVIGWLKTFPVPQTLKNVVESITTKLGELYTSINDGVIICWNTFSTGIMHAAHNVAVLFKGQIALQS